MVGLPEWDERKLPAPPAVWNWNKGADPFELWIFFFKRDATGLDEIQKLVAAMQSPAWIEKVLAQQTRKFAKNSKSRMTGKQPIIKGPKARTAPGRRRRAQYRISVARLRAEGRPERRV